MNSASLLDSMYVATPCPADWERMPGDERVRFCAQCGLHVYNVSAMGAAEAEALVARTEGRLCVRLFRRADGTMLTRDCPVGLRLWRRRARRAAGAALTALLSLCGGFAVAARPAPVQGQALFRSQLKIKRSKAAAKDSRPAAGGTVFDVNGAVVAGARVRLVKEGGEKEQKVTANAEGHFRLECLDPGPYTLVIESPGFVTFRTKLKLEAGEDVSLDVTLLEAPTLGRVLLLPGDPIS